MSTFRGAPMGARKPRYGTNPPMPGKGRAIGYTDYYKQNSSTPGAHLEVNIIPGTQGGDRTPFRNRTKPVKYGDGDDEKREALRRRLKKMRKGK